jgi:hypothetical protein
MKKLPSKAKSASFHFWNRSKTQKRENSKAPTIKRKSIACFERLRKRLNRGMCRLKNNRLRRGRRPPTRTGELMCGPGLLTCQNPALFASGAPANTVGVYAASSTPKFKFSENQFQMLADLPIP